jgi:hypothetical protein
MKCAQKGMTEQWKATDVRQAAGWPCIDLPKSNTPGNFVSMSLVTLVLSSLARLGRILFVVVATLTAILLAQAQFEGDVDIGDGWKFSAWFGFYNDTWSPWLYHLEHGFIYLADGANADSVFLWDSSLESWLFTTPQTYPNLYAFIEGGWLYYYAGTVEPRVFLSYSLEDHIYGVTEGTKLTPTYKSSSILLASSSLAEKSYLAFPVTLHRGEDDYLLSFKRGDAHSKDSGAFWEVYQLDTRNGAITGPTAEFRLPGLILQNGEWIRFPNGDISLFIDVQDPVEGPTLRLGLREYRSTNNGLNFQQHGKVGVIDGVEYGYLFQGINIGTTTYALVMTFDNFAGGRRSVDVIASDDNGTSWSFVKNLTEELGGIQINESSLVPNGGGFLIATRGYDNVVRLHLTDSQFSLIEDTSLTNDYEFIDSLVGRPRLFERNSRCYLMGRNWTESRSDHPMQLCLFRLDPAELTVRSYAILDNEMEEDVTDGYYSAPQWLVRDGKLIFSVVTYKGIEGNNPDIIRLEYRWNEVR